MDKELGYHDVKDILKKKLEAKGLVFDKDGFCLISKGAIINFSAVNRGSFYHDYKTINITISTNSYASRKRLYVRKFDIQKGDYSLIAEKVLEIQDKNSEIAQQINQHELDEKFKLKQLLKVLKPYGGKQEYSNTVKVDFKEFDLEFNFYPKDKEYASVSIDFNGGEEVAIKLIKLLKGEQNENCKTTTGR